MNAADAWLMIFGVALVSLAPRILPVAIFSRRKMPPWLEKWLSYVAPAVLGALAAVSILAPNGSLELSRENLYLWAALPTFAAGLITRSIFLTLLVGIAVMAALFHLLG
ncbi:MAG: AzlD domain-containing protein [Firmicutes bacterium]|nr:AzlD domain-containing protein [Bacillota bacterium]HPU01145.1 AzlD domain-containing protein [Bacillota bacterium]